MRRIALPLLLLTLAACGGGMSYSKPGGTLAMFNQDKARCQYEAKASTASTPNYFGAGFDMAMRQVELMDLCLKANGWVQEGPMPTTTKDGKPLTWTAVP